MHVRAKQSKIVKPKVNLHGLMGCKLPAHVAFLSVAFVVIISAQFSDITYAQNVISLDEEFESGETQSELETVFPNSVLDEEEAQALENAAAATEQAESGSIRPSLLLRPTVLGATQDTRPITERALAQGPVGEQSADGTFDTRSNVKAGAEQSGSARPIPENPYAAEGFPLGSWDANASIEQGFNAQTNIDGAEEAESGFEYITTLIFSAVSNWSRHSATIDATLASTGELEEVSDQTPSANIALGLGLELADDLAGSASLEYGYTLDSINSPVTTSTVSEQPGVQTIRGNVGIAQTNRRVMMSLRGGIERNTYGEAKLSDGSDATQSHRDNDYYTTSGRISYESKPANTHYIEAGYGIRIHDPKFDSSSGVRDANSYSIALGSDFQLSEKLSGNIALGYQLDDYESSTLEDLEGFTLNGAINWSPYREMNVRLEAGTSFNGGATTTDGGTIVRSLNGTITRQATERLELNATGGFELTFDKDNELNSSVWNIGSGFEYAINKHLSLKGAIDYENQTDEDTSISISNTTLSTSIKLQR